MLSNSKVEGSRQPITFDPFQETLTAFVTFVVSCTVMGTEGVTFFFDDFQNAQKFSECDSSFMDACNYASSYDGCQNHTEVYKEIKKSCATRKTLKILIGYCKSKYKRVS